MGAQNGVEIPCEGGGVVIFCQSHIIFAGSDFEPFFEHLRPAKAPPSDPKVAQTGKNAATCDTWVSIWKGKNRWFLTILFLLLFVSEFSVLRCLSLKKHHHKTFWWLSGPNLSQFGVPKRGGGPPPLPSPSTTPWLHLGNMMISTSIFGPHLGPIWVF